MILFATLSVLLLAVTAVFLLPPLWLGLKPASGADRKAANLAIFRDQLAELEREKAEGTLAEADFEQAKRELQRRLLEEVQDETVSASHGPSRSVAIALLILLPLAATGGYALLGTPAALNPEATQARPKVTAAQIEAVVEKLAARLKENPDDTKGWIMLARSYKAMGRYQEAGEAYAKAEKALAGDANLLADYAETLAMANQAFQGKPKQLIEQALKVDPQNPNALLMAGAAAMESGDKKKAVAYWEKLLPLLEPGSEEATMVQQSISKLKGG